jgi:ribonuclease Z
MLAFEEVGAVIVVDCGGDVVQRLLQAGVRLGEIIGVIVTHEHPDHVAGFPLMIQKLWLAGRRSPLPVYGIGAALAQARRCWEAFNSAGWEGLPEIAWREFGYVPGVVVMEEEPWRVTATPSMHGVPSVALRVENRMTGRACVYSGDTAPSGGIAKFARGARVLIHEATGALPGHSTARDAAHIAAAAGVEVLHLVHLPPEAELGEREMRAAREVFAQTFKAGELEKIDF